MKRISFIILFLSITFVCTLVDGCSQKSLNFSNSDYRTTFVQEYDAGGPDENELEETQCPIPMECRVKNYTGVQCVFSSLECLARWGEIEELLQPEPLTSRSGCKSYSGPTDAASKVSKYGIRFENEYQNKKKAIELLKKAMADGRGALMDVPGHAIVICHYDEKAGIVKIIDNSDRSLKIQTWSMEKFNKLWKGWIMVIYGKNDPFPYKAKNSLANELPIIDRNNPQESYPKNYIPAPKK